VKDLDIVDALADPDLLGASFPGGLKTWGTWIAVLKAAFGQPLTRKERRAFEAVAGGRKSPEKRVRELWCEFRFNPARDSDLMSAGVPI
jgi:hypothetical protein